jgi:hypothetical protein
LNRIPIFDRAVEFATHIPTGLLHFQQNAIQFVFDLCLREHGKNYIRGGWVIWGMNFRAKNNRTIEIEK